MITDKQIKGMQGNAVLHNVRRSVCVEFILKDYKKFETYYWEDEQQRFEDIKNWYNKSPLHRINYVD